MTEQIASAVGHQPEVASPSYLAMLDRATKLELALRDLASAIESQPMGDSTWWTRELASAMKSAKKLLEVP